VDDAKNFVDTSDRKGESIAEGGENGKCQLIVVSLGEANIKIQGKLNENAPTKEDDTNKSVEDSQ